MQKAKHFQKPGPHRWDPTGGDPPKPFPLLCFLFFFAQGAACHASFLFGEFFGCTLRSPGRRLGVLVQRCYGGRHFGGLENRGKDFETGTYVGFQHYQYNLLVPLTSKYFAPLVRVRTYQSMKIATWTVPFLL